MAASTWSTTDKSGNITLSGSNLIATATTTGGVRGKDPKRTGKYYIEYTSTTAQNINTEIGFAASKMSLAGTNPASVVYPNVSAGNLTGYDTFGVSANYGNVGVTVTSGTLICYAIDLDNAQLWIRSGAAGNWNGNAANNPATGVGGINIAAIGLGQGIDCYPFTYIASASASVTANFGGSAFTGTVPAGFTSGWDDSVSIVTNMVASQVAIEEWGVGTPAMQLTQIAIEEWASVATVVPTTFNIGAMILA